VLIAAVGIFFADFPRAFSAPVAPNAGPLWGMSGVLLWAFIGLESATIPSESVKNPKKTIPLATVAGVLLTAAVYIGGALVIGGVIPQSELLASKAPYVDAAAKIFGEWGRTFMTVVGIVGIVGSLNGWILIQGQVSRSAAEEGLFPKYFLKTNKHGAPIGVTVGSILMTVLFLLTYQPSVAECVNRLINLSVIAMLLPYFYSIIAFGYMFFLNKKIFSKTEKTVLPAVGCIALAYVSFAILGLGESMISLAFVLFLLCAPFYCFSRSPEQKGDFLLSEQTKTDKSFLEKNPTTT
jgi:APA family basic amino acid/polyamine antiporter